WQGKQLSDRIGCTSRAKSTSAAVSREAEPSATSSAAARAGGRIGGGLRGNRDTGGRPPGRGGARPLGYPETGRRGNRFTPLPRSHAPRGNGRRRRSASRALSRR